MIQIYCIDTNLLVLLVVGSASENFIASHKRTRNYTREDFRRLRKILSNSQDIIVTPNILTETSNLIRQFAEPGRSEVVAVFKEFLLRANEQYVKSAEAAQRPEFSYLGLTDAGLVSAGEDKVTLLTDDLDMYVARVSAGRLAINFSHAREAWLGI